MGVLQVAQCVEQLLKQHGAHCATVWVTNATGTSCVLVIDDALVGGILACQGRSVSVMVLHTCD